MSRFGGALYRSPVTGNQSSDKQVVIKDGLKYCADCGKQTWHAVSVWPDPTQCPYCAECCEKSVVPSK